MAKNYGRRERKRPSGSGKKPIVLVLAAFVCGYIGATVFDVNQLSAFIGKEILARKTQETPAKAAVAQASLPKPKFEFYTLLASDGTPVPTVVKSTTAVPTSVAVSNTAVSTLAAKSAVKQLPPLNTTKKIEASTPVSKEAYLVQIAAFKNRTDAEHLKASLTLKGFNVYVTAVSQQNSNWFRVIIGPFASKAEAQKAQLQVAQKERYKGMVRKMNA